MKRLIALVGLILALGATPALATTTGGPGADQIYGTRAADSLAGGSGNDVIFGRAGDDEIWGGPGQDSIFAGRGFDTCHVETRDIYSGCEVVL